jgi:hypothetical protein
MWFARNATFDAGIAAPLAHEGATNEVAEKSTPCEESCLTGESAEFRFGMTLPAMISF